MNSEDAVSLGARDVEEMNGKIVSGTMAALFLISTLTLAFNIPSVKASGTIYIRANGSIDPPDAPIQQNGNVYTFTGDIFDSIEVEKGGITIEGSGFNLKGLGAGVGLNLTTVTDVTVKNTKITEFYRGIYASSALNITLTNNTIVGPGYHSGDGIFLLGQGNNTLTGNHISQTYFGMLIYGPGTGNKISNNTITTNQYGILLGNGCDGNTISGNLFTNNTDGIHLDRSQHNLIKDNRIIGNVGRGIYFDKDGDGHSTIYNNTIANNSHGIYTDLFNRGNNIITCNLIASNTYAGIRLDTSLNNTIYRNNFFNNTRQVIVSSLVANLWDNGVEGNYWSNYSGVDLNHDGIGDSPHVLGALNQDNYPLMNPYIPGDCNHDGAVNMTDVDMVRNAWLSVEGELNYNPHTDFNMDGIVNIKDATIIGVNWLRHT